MDCALSLMKLKSVNINLELIKDVPRKAAAKP
jgi:hypothetical protein